LTRLIFAQKIAELLELAPKAIFASIKNRCGIQFIEFRSGKLRLLNAYVITL
jgi:hypothetical protein